MVVWRRRQPLRWPPALPERPFSGPSSLPFSTSSHQLRMVSGVQSSRGCAFNCKQTTFYLFITNFKVKQSNISCSLTIISPSSSCFGLQVRMKMHFLVSSEWHHLKFFFFPFFFFLFFSLFRLGLSRPSIRSWGDSQAAGHWASCGDAHQHCYIHAGTVRHHQLLLERLTAPTSATATHPRGFSHNRRRRAGYGCWPPPSHR